MSEDPRPRMLLLLFTELDKEPRAKRQLRRFRDEYRITTVGTGGRPDGAAEHIELAVAAQVPALLRKALYAIQAIAFRLRWYRIAYWAIPLHRGLRRILRVGTWDVVIAHDVLTLPLAATIPSRRGFVADMHEYAPRMYEDDPAWVAVAAPYYDWICRTALPSARLAITVARGIAEEYERVYGVPFETVVNATDPSGLRVRPTARPIRLVFSGNADRSRQLETMIEAVRRSEAAVELDLYLAGDAPDYLGELRDRIGDEPRIRIRPPVAYLDLVPALHGYDAGLVVTGATSFNNLWSLPNKFFDYVQARLAIIVGPSPEMARIVADRGLGVVLEDFQVETLAAAISRLDPATVDEWKARADAVAQEITGPGELAKLADLIDRM